MSQAREAGGQRVKCECRQRSSFVVGRDKNEGSDSSKAFMSILTAPETGRERERELLLLLQLLQLLRTIMTPGNDNVGE